MGRHENRIHPRQRWRGCSLRHCTGLKPNDDLQDAITNAADDGTLTLCAGTWVVPETLEIVRPLTIIGAGAGTTILSGDEKRRVLAIAANVPVTLQALTITRGTDSFGGGGIYSGGKLTLEDGSSVEKNTAVGDGGGIFAKSHVTLKPGSRVFDNDAGLGGGGIFPGTGTLTLEAGSQVTYNTVTTVGGAGALYNNGTVRSRTGC